VLGRALGARGADVIFTAQHQKETAQAFYRDMKQRAADAGRPVGAPLIMPGLAPVVGRSRQEAQDKQAQLQEAVPPAVGLATLATSLGEVDLSAYPLDGPLPELPPTNGPTSRRQLLVELARRDNLTIRQLYQHVTGARGHLTVVGTAQDVADVMQDWLESQAADGFNIMPAHFPAALEDFTQAVVPELQRRGLFRTQYEGHTLRDHLGLQRPVHPHAR